MDKSLWDALMRTPIRFWVCPVREHRDRKRTVTVEWRGDVAYCTFPDCDRTSANTQPSDYPIGDDE